VLIEDRLAPLLKRTFPSADIRAGNSVSESARAEADIVVSFDQLVYLFGDDATKMARNFTPLKADAALTQEFRDCYLRSGARPLIGLSWGSKSYNKDVPNLREWSQFIRSSVAQFVSLQYGKVPADLSILCADDPTRVIHDTSVDQLKDMDRFAAQICALDAVVSISNTPAHFTGALGVPSLFLIDDTFQTNWPVVSETVPWYPHARLIKKEGRSWPSVLEETLTRLSSMPKTPNSRRSARRTGMSPGRVL
jgi:hypothetical protein